MLIVPQARDKPFYTSLQLLQIGSPPKRWAQGEWRQMASFTKSLQSSNCMNRSSKLSSLRAHHNPSGLTGAPVRSSRKSGSPKGMSFHQKWSGSSFVEVSQALSTAIGMKKIFVIDLATLLLERTPQNMDV